MPIYVKAGIITLALPVSVPVPVLPEIEIKVFSSLHPPENIKASDTIREVVRIKRAIASFIFAPFIQHQVSPPCHAFSDMDG